MHTNNTNLTINKTAANTAHLNSNLIPTSSSRSSISPIAQFSSNRLYTHTISLLANTKTKIKKQKQKPKKIYDETTSIDLPTLPQSMPSTPMQATTHNHFIQTNSYEIDGNVDGNADADADGDVDGLVLSSNTTLGTPPLLPTPTTPTSMKMPHSSSGSFLTAPPLVQLKRKWTKLHRQRHRRRHSNGSASDAKELDKLVLQSIAWDDSDIY